MLARGVSGTCRTGRFPGPVWPVLWVGGSMRLQSTTVAVCAEALRSGPRSFLFMGVRRLRYLRSISSTEITAGWFIWLMPASMSSQWIYTPRYPHSFGSFATDWDEIDTVVEFIRSLRSHRELWQSRARLRETAHDAAASFRGVAPVWHVRGAAGLECEVIGRTQTCGLVRVWCGGTSLFHICRIAGATSRLSRRQLRSPSVAQAPLPVWAAWFAS